MNFFSINFSLNASLINKTSDLFPEDVEADTANILGSDNDLSARIQKFLNKPHQQILLLLSLVAILLNVLSLCALGKVQNRVNTHFRFIISLALSDIVIGVSI
jgi:hypothetical protein